MSITLILKIQITRSSIQTHRTEKLDREQFKNPQAFAGNSSVLGCLLNCFHFASALRISSFVNESFGYRSWVPVDAALENEKRKEKTRNPKPSWVLLGFPANSEPLP